MIFVFLFLTSLSMRISSCIHIAANGIISFFFMGQFILSFIPSFSENSVLSEVIP